ncbi:hypothetical protein OSB04_013814 [Centaurea solstitialis]|uniref:Dirigent protein n=1 Tax=Centaurea solstitialis TaxID=347529 RepID=A0AA38TDZ5_9ASTR|nr:hypothetical protein OSB04_013814 [Centaurea solstitialis]
MAKIHLKTRLIITIFFFYILTTIQSKSFSRNLSKKSLDFKKEKLSHLHFYFHDIVTGQHPTAIKVASSPTTNTSSSLFGLVMMIDDMLTLTPEPGSKEVGRAQGIYASADLEKLGFLMTLNYFLQKASTTGAP